MLLCVDIGNTQTHVGCFEGEALRESWRIATDAAATGDEIGTRLLALLDASGLSRAEVAGTIVSTVVPQLAPAWTATSERYLGAAPLIVGPEIRTGMPIRIDNPPELGSDRLVNAIAAYAAFGRCCVSVDFGTSINFDAVSDEGEYLGGAIAPGLEVSLGALVGRTAKLPRIDLGGSARAIGKGTVEAIRSGFVHGFAGLIDRIAERMEEELGGEVEFVATGGQASIVVPHCRRIDRIDELLTLNGLRLIWERNE